MKKILFFAFSVIVFCNDKSYCQNIATENSPFSIDSFIIKKAEKIYVQSKVPGILIATLIDGKKKYYNFGFADVDKKIKFDSSTVFEIASITKTFTAFVLTKILKEKGISDTSPVSKYLPDSVQTNPSLEGISFLSLMNHTSGLPRIPEDLFLTSKNYLQPYENYSKEKLYHYLKNKKVHPTGKSEYSNLGAGLAGILAENISHKSYEKLLEQNIFKPFRIHYPDSNAYKAVGYNMNKPAEYWKMTSLRSAGALRLNAVGMLAYLQGMIKPANKKVAKIIALVTTPTISINQQIKVARGWHTLEQENKPSVFWHNGGSYGFSSFCAFSKEKKVAVFVVVNSFDKNNISDGELGFSIIKKLTE